uniref:Uncharacterized protein n=1 Tax=Anguilla anguilla TaxID=7936 RepID=A0A0E9TJN9_ANGAN
MPFPVCEKELETYTVQSALKMGSNSPPVLT